MPKKTQEIYIEGKLTSKEIEKLNHILYGLYHIKGAIYDHDTNLSLVLYEKDFTEIPTFPELLLKLGYKVLY